jgi:carboxymethylenebutenolidase
MRSYLVEEVVADYAEAHLPRREALRRLGLLGIGTFGASALLAACGSDDDNRSTRQPVASTGTPTSVPGAIPAPAPIVRFAGPNAELQGAWAGAARPKGSVLVIHENRGLTDHIRTIPPRFAAAGFSALAVDLLSEEGGTAALGGDAQAMAALAQAPVERLLADLRAGIDELERREAGHQIAVIGFCFGGGMTWQLLASGETRIAAAAPFYGPCPADADFSGSNAAVLAVYGELDTRVNATRDTAQAALQRAGLTHEIRVFAGANHAFFNDTGPSFNPVAAAEAYQAVLDWFNRYLD